MFKAGWDTDWLKASLGNKPQIKKGKEGEGYSLGAAYGRPWIGSLVQ